MSRFISKRARFAWASSSTLRSRSWLTVAQLLLHGDEVVEHPVEGVRQLLELVAGLDLGCGSVSLPAAMASETSRRCLTGLTIT